MARKKVNNAIKMAMVCVANRMFLERGFSNTSVKAIADELEISTGHITFYFPTKEHLLAELVDLLCRFQWKRMEEEADEGISSVLAICLELTSMASACEADPVIKDFFLSAYCSPMCLEIIRRNDTDRSKKVFAAYRPGWTDEQFAEAEILCSGIEYATLMTANDPVTLETRIAGALNNILGIYGIPEETRQTKTKKVFAMDYRTLGKRVLEEFKEYVEQANEQAFMALLKR